MCNLLRVLAVLAFFSFAISIQAQPQLARDYVRGPAGKLAVTIEPDWYAPTMPPNFDGYAPSCLEVSLTWSTSTDIGTGVTGYYLYEDSSYVVDITDTSWGTTLGWGGREIQYQLEAHDAAGNLSDRATIYVVVPNCDDFFDVQSEFLRWMTRSDLPFPDWNECLYVDRRRIHDPQLKFRLVGRVGGGL